VINSNDMTTVRNYEAGVRLEPATVALNFAWL